MHSENIKFSRLVKVAKMYYEEDLSQNEIANFFNISRPMVSKLLKEAKELNIVSITINDVKNVYESLGEKIASLFNLKKVVVIPSSCENFQELYSKAIFDILFVKTTVTQRIGVGFGSSIGDFSDYCENKDIKKLKLNGEIIPIIGSLHASFKSYNTNKIAKSLSKISGLKATALNFQTLLNSPSEKLVYKKTPHFKDVNTVWDNLDNVIINVSNIFTTPDLATAIRFDNSLINDNAVGRILAYPFTINGDFIPAKRDIVMQIELAQLKKSRESIAVLTPKLDSKSAIGALNTKIFTKCIISENLAQEIIKSCS